VKIVYCAYSRAGLECLYSLMLIHEVDCKNILVFTHNSIENEVFLSHLQALNINYKFESINNCYELVYSFKPDYLISVYYRNIINEKILKLVLGRAMNLHPSLLPKYRGTKSSVWAIINGERYTGISFHYMTKGVDEGNLILQRRVKIQESDTAFSLYHKLITLFVLSFSEAFQGLKNNVAGQEQQGESSYYGRVLPHNGILTLSEINDLQAERFIRAMYFPPFEGARFQIDDGRIVAISNPDEIKLFR
jgi:methionyl-tRNA formyltransferase